MEINSTICRPVVRVLFANRGREEDFLTTFPESKLRKIWSQCYKNNLVLKKL